MNIIELSRMFEIHDGVMKTSELYDAGISKYELNKLIDANTLERITQGYYKLYDDDMSEIKLLFILLPNGVLCFDTALFHYGYSDRTPVEWHIAVNKDISKSRVKLDYPYIKPYFIEQKLLSVGVDEVVIDDVSVKMYNRDRLICDCLKYESKMDVEIFNKSHKKLY